MRKILYPIIIFLLAISLLAPSDLPILRISLVFAADAHGNQIDWLAVYQLESGSYDLKVNFTASSGTTNLVADEYVRFLVMVRFNSTLASSIPQAESYTRIYMNLTDGGVIWNNLLLNQTGTTTLSGGFYHVQKVGDWNDSGIPSAGVTYSGSAIFKGYY